MVIDLIVFFNLMLYSFGPSQNTLNATVKRKDQTQQLKNDFAGSIFLN